MNTELQEKILAVTNGTKFGCILRCAMDRNVGGVAPQFVGKAIITSDKFILCDFIDGDNNGHHGAFVGANSDLDQNVAGLSKHLKLGPDEDRELRTLVDGWLGK